MKTLHETCRAGARQLQWVRPGHEPAYVLIPTQDAPVTVDVLAVLEVRPDEKAGLFRPYPATAQAADGRWAFRADGIFSLGVQAYAAQPGAAPPPRVRSSILGGDRLVLQGGEMLRWRCRDDTWELSSAGSAPLVRCQERGHANVGEVGESAIELGERAAQREDLSMLVALGWYLIVVRRLRQSYGIL